MRKGEELKAPRHASAAATRDGSLPYVTANCLIPDTYRAAVVYYYLVLVTGPFILNVLTPYLGAVYTILDLSKSYLGTVLKI